MLSNLQACTILQLKKQQHNTNLKSSSFSFSSWAPYFSPTDPPRSSHFGAPGVFVMFHTHLRQTSCFRRSPVLGVSPKNQDRISFFLPKTPQILNDIYRQNSAVSSSHDYQYGGHGFSNSSFEPFRPRICCVGCLGK